MYFPRLSMYLAAGSRLCTSGASTIFCPPARFLMTQIQKIDERYDEHPNQVHEVPVQAGDLQVIGVVTAAFVSDSHGKQGYHAGANVQQVEAGDAEEGRAKKSGAPRIVKHGHAFTNQREPLTNVQQGKNNAENGGDHRPTKCPWFVTCFRCSHSQEHSQAAGEKDEGHQRDVAYVVERSRPIRRTISQKPV